MAKQVVAKRKLPKDFVDKYLGKFTKRESKMFLELMALYIHPEGLCWTAHILGVTEELCEYLTNILVRYGVVYYEYSTTYKIIMYRIRGEYLRLGK